MSLSQRWSLCCVNKGLLHFVGSRKSMTDKFIPLTDLPRKVCDRQCFTLKSKLANCIQPCLTRYFYCLLEDVLVFLKEAVCGDSHSGSQSVGLSKSPLSCLAAALWREGPRQVPLDDRGCDLYDR